jgi:CheY-like chemotaxis protein
VVTALVIDVDAEARRAVHSILKAAGFDVIEAACGREGLALSRAHRPALVVTAILMPVMDGLEVIRALREEGFAGAIIAVSGYQSRAGLYRQAARLMGADETLAEPFSASELAQAVERLL